MEIDFLSVGWSGRTDRGPVRKNNEDAFLGLAVDAQGARFLGSMGDASLAESDYLFAVSDGMGGAQAGEFASRIAVDKITRMIPPLFKQRAAGLATGFGDVLEELYAEIHAALCYLGDSYEECSGMGATLSLCWITPGWLFFGHIGDSRIYYLPTSGGFQQLTHDDTHVGWLVRQGTLNERQAKTHPRRNVLQKALGAGHQFVSPQVGSVGLVPGDRFVLVTDGITDGLYEDALREAVESSPTADSLVRAALAGGGQDNATAVVVAINGH